MVETKFKDGATTVTNIHTIAQRVLLNDTIAKGDNRHTQRIGRSLHAKKIFVRGYINNNNGTPTDDIIRVLLVRHKDSQGTDINTAYTDLLYNMTVTSYGVLSNRNINHTRDFKVYLDTTFAVDTTGHSYIPFKIVQKLDHEVVYNESADTGAIATIEQNPLYLIFIGIKADDTTNNPRATIEWRYTYNDI